MLAQQVFKDRHCSTCTLKDQKKFGCDEDISPFMFDGEKLRRCPLRPYKDDPQYFSDLFRLYSFREKGIMAEQGAFYDQPNYYIEAMVVIDGAIADSYDEKQISKVSDEDSKLTQDLAAKGIIFTPKD